MSGNDYIKTENYNPDAEDGANILLFHSVKHNLFYETEEVN